MFLITLFLRLQGLLIKATDGFICTIIATHMKNTGVSWKTSNSSDMTSI